MAYQKSMIVEDRRQNYVAVCETLLAASWFKEYTFLADTFHTFHLKFAKIWFNEKAK